MKRFSLPSLLAVVVVVLFAVACSDATTAPANSHALVAPTGIAGDLGKPPPPPVKTVLTVNVQSHITGFAIFTGSYFSNGEITPDDEGIPTFDGTAWLRLDNKQSTINGTSGTVSANARFMARDVNFSGNGTLFIGGHAYTITAVDVFTPYSDCGPPELGFSSSLCAIIHFSARDENGDPHTGQIEAWDSASCLVPNSGSGGGFIFTCNND